MSKNIVIWPTVHCCGVTWCRVCARKGYLVYLSDGDVPFFRVSFSPMSSRIGYQKKANFLEQVVKTCQKRKFCYNGLLFSQICVILSILFTDFF